MRKVVEKYLRNVCKGEMKRMDYYLEKAIKETKLNLERGHLSGHHIVNILENQLIIMKTLDELLPKD